MSVFDKFIQLLEHFFRLAGPERLPDTVAIHRGGNDKAVSGLLLSSGRGLVVAPEERCTQRDTRQYPHPAVR